jgi:hypothetical protein
LLSVVLLAGCAAQPTPTPTVPSSAPAAPSPAPTSTPTLLAEMPASDGGAMLWPAVLNLPVNDGSGITYTHYGFVDVNGKLVVPQRYDGYQYCPNKEGRSSFLIASLAYEKDDIYDLTGKLLLTSPTSDTLCGGVDRIIIRHVIDAELGKIDEGLLNVVTGKIEVPIKRDRHVRVVTDEVVNVSDPSGEYFDDLHNNARIPHPGYLDDQAGVQDAQFILVTDHRRDLTTKDVKVGVIDGLGKWLLKPSLEAADGFAAGFSPIAVGDQYTFMDSTFAHVGGLWDEIDSISSDLTNATLGYLVTRGSDVGVLGVDLSVIVPAGSAKVDCDFSTGGCAVTEGEATSAVFPPSAAKTPLPQGFSLVLSKGFYADRLPSEGPNSQRVFVVATGQAVPLPPDSECEAVASTWVQCTSNVGMSPSVVLNAAGQVTPFASVIPAKDPIPEAGYGYYWVTSGRIEGFVDSNGTWRYQQSRYTQVED